MLIALIFHITPGHKCNSVLIHFCQTNHLERKDAEHHIERKKDIQSGKKEQLETDGPLHVVNA